MHALTPSQRLKICLLIFFVLINAVPFTVAAQDPPQPIEPHLGYGIHVGPNTRVNYTDVNDLRMDWVKIYEPGQAGAFSNKRILLRYDVIWQQDWNAFKSNLAGYIAGLGSRIDAIEVGNEPNLGSEWHGRTPNAWEYVQVLRVAYQVIKSVNPNLIVVSAGLAPTITLPSREAISDLEYAREMMENGAGQWFDAFGYHPYGYNMPPSAPPGGQQPLVFRRTEQIRQIMEENGVYKQIWLTEFGWLRDPGEDGIGCSDVDPNFSGFAWLRVSGNTQANYLIQAFEYAHENWPWAGPMFVWNLNWSLMDWLPPCDHRRWFGILTPSGNRTPAFNALARMPHYYSNYTPKIEIMNDELVVKGSLACPKRMLMGEISVQNIGYPANVRLDVQPVNGIDPPFVEIKPNQAKIGDKIEVYVNTQGVRTSGQYPVYINIRYSIGGQVKSQSMQGFVIITENASDC
jgi:hypothetical protein